MNIDKHITSNEFSDKSNYVEIYGNKMYFVDEGYGDPILFLHGNGCSSYIWRNIIPHVSPVGRCIALDLIGMGKSSKPDIAYRFVDHYEYVKSFIDTLDLKNLTLVLHDWGAPLGFHYAMNHPERIKALAFTSDAMFTPIASWGQFTKQQKDLFQAFRSPETGWDMVVNQNMFMDLVIPGGIVRQLSQKEIDCYNEPFSDPSNRTPLWRWPQELPIEGEPQDVTHIVEQYSIKLKKSELPKLLLHATMPQDVRPVPMSGVTDASLTNAKKHPAVGWCTENLKNITIKNIGIGIHYVQEDCPHQIGRALNKWIAAL
jgi:haloalkane dehalogenase